MEFSKLSLKKQVVIKCFKFRFPVCHDLLALALKAAKDNALNKLKREGRGGRGEGGRGSGPESSVLSADTAPLLC